MAGHSKWANIKHKKGRQDAKKGKIWGKLSKAIMVAVQEGGADPATNLALRYAMDEAKAANMPKATIENAIKRALGEGNTAKYEAVTYEGYAPNGVAILVECLTEKRNRTVPEIRKIFEKKGGNLGVSGSVAYLFRQKGQISIDKGQVDEDRLMEIVLEAGAEDVTDEMDYWLVTTEPSAYQDVKGAIEEAGLVPQVAQLSMIPTLNVPCSGEDAQRVLSLISELEDHDDVQKVYANFDIPENELSTMTA